MPDVELSAGTIAYEDTGGSGPTIVFLHGLLMDHTLWDAVIPALRDDFRCVLPTMPFGGHERAMRPDADLTFAGQVRLVAELLEALDLRDVTLVFSDWGGAQGLIAQGLTERIGKLVLTSCEAFDNYPPGLPGRLIGVIAKLPGGINLAVQQLRVKATRGLPVTWGWMSKRGVPHDTMDAWLRPAQHDRWIRRDVKKYATKIPPKADLLAWAEGQRSFTKPVLIAWASEDRVMPPGHGRRLAEIFPDARHVEVADSYTLIPIDQPGWLARELRSFAHPVALAPDGTGAGDPLV